MQRVQGVRVQAPRWQVCICKSNSTFDLSTIGSDSKRQYVELMRAYNKKFPNKSLANVTVKVVREALDKKPGEKAGTGDSGKMAYLASVSSVLLELRTPAEHTGCKFLYIAVDKASKFALAGGVADYTEASITGALNEIRARTRPTHGEVEIFRMDSHATHKSKGVRDYTCSARRCGCSSC